MAYALRSRTQNKRKTPSDNPINVLPQKKQKTSSLSASRQSARAIDVESILYSDDSILPYSPQRPRTGVFNQKAISSKQQAPFPSIQPGENLYEPTSSVWSRLSARHVKKAAGSADESQPWQVEGSDHNDGGQGDREPEDRDGDHGDHPGDENDGNDGDGSPEDNDPPRGPGGGGFGGDGANDDPDRGDGHNRQYPHFTWPGVNGTECWPVKLRKGWKYHGQWRRYWPEVPNLILPGAIIRTPIITTLHDQRHWNPAPRCYGNECFPTPVGYARAKMRYLVVIACYSMHFITLPMFTYNKKGLRGFGKDLRHEHILVRDHRLMKKDRTWPSYIKKEADDFQPLVTKYIWSGNPNYLHPNGSVKFTFPISLPYDQPAEFIGMLEQSSIDRLYRKWTELWKKPGLGSLMMQPPLPDNESWPEPPENWGEGYPDSTERVGKVGFQGIPFNPSYRRYTGADADSSRLDTSETSSYSSAFPRQETGYQSPASNQPPAGARSSLLNPSQSSHIPPYQQTWGPSHEHPSSQFESSGPQTQFSSPWAQNQRQPQEWPVDPVQQQGPTTQSISTTGIQPQSAWTQPLQQQHQRQTSSSHSQIRPPNIGIPGIPLQASSSSSIPSPSWRQPGPPPPFQQQQQSQQQAQPQSSGIIGTLGQPQPTSQRPQSPLDAGRQQQQHRRDFGTDWNYGGGRDKLRRGTWRK